MPKIHRTIPKLTPQQIERFWAKVDKSSGQGPEGECWTPIREHGEHYSVFWLNGASWSMHRIAYFISTGDDPLSLNVCHHCDYKPCCHPDHLFKGTQKENREDCVRKGRTATGKNNGAYTHPEKMPRGDSHWARRCPDLLKHGTSNPAAKLAEQDVLNMRRLYDSGEVRSSVTLGRMFGVDRHTARKIVLRELWKHLP